MGTTTIGIKMESELAGRLRLVAQACERAPHWIAKRAIEQFVEREERRLAMRAEDLKRWERYVATGDSVAGEDVDAWLDRVADGEDVAWSG